MIKIMFFISPYLGHINPTLGIVQRLISKKVNVLYYSMPKYKDLIMRTGATFCLYDVPFTNLQLHLGENNKSNHKSLESIIGLYSRRFEQQNALKKYAYKEIKQKKPNIIVYDYCDGFWAKQAAEELDIVTIASIPTFATCNKMLDVAADECLSQYFMMKPEDSEFPISDAKQIERIIAAVIKKKYNLFEFRPLEYGNSKVLNLVHTSKTLQPFGHVFNNSFHFVGLNTHIRKEIEFDYKRLDNRPLIYIACGSVISLTKELRKIFYNAFNNMCLQVIMVIGHDDINENIEEIPNNFIVVEEAPQLELLKKAKLFITHGGMNSVNEAVYFGVPMIVIPLNGDEFAVANQVQKLGLGKTLNAHEISTQNLQLAVKQIYNNKEYIETINKMQIKMKQCSNISKAVTLILESVKKS